MKSLVDSLIGTASYTSEPSFERTLLGQEGVEVRWQLPTFTLAARKFLATMTILMR